MAQSCDRIVYGLRNSGCIVHIFHFTSHGDPFKTDTLVNGTYTAIPVSENEAHISNLCWNFINRLSLPFTKLVCFGGYLPLIMGPVFARWLDIPLITLFRGNDFDASLFNPRRKSLVDDVLLNSMVVGCVTRDQVQKIIKLYPRLDLRYTPNGIDPEGWKALPSEEKFAGEWRHSRLEGRMAVGMFGQLKEKKGLEVLLSCFRKPAIASRCFLLLAGEYGDSLESSLRELNIHFELLPFLDRNELVKYYSACDVVVIPSHYEGMPNVLLEAGALGKPVIASAVGGMKDILSEVDDSLLFYPGDIDGLETILLRFAGMQPAEISGVGQKLKQHIVTHYNSQQELKPYVELFCGL